MNGVIRRKLIEVEYQYPSKSIEQWYKRAVNPDKHQRKSKKKEERLRNKREIGVLAQRLNIPANTRETQQQQMPWSQIWPRRQEIPQQWVLAGSAPMKEVKRTNTAMVNLNQQTGLVPRYDLYAIDIDRGRNCYNCGKSGYIARNYRNQRFVKQERKIEYRDNSNNKNNYNLNRKENLIVLDQVLTIISL